MTKHVAMTKRVVIVGGGIAGLARAIAFSRRGIAATLVERQARWEPLSSGLFIYSDGLAALDKLSVLDGICASGWVSPTAETYTSPLSATRLNGCNRVTSRLR
jgi:2-polyprenyl-6-methoxyphenol hydroxylase-like FAD-dependent oxidoreductase